jgi:hypothetical protein
MPIVRYINDLQTEGHLVKTTLINPTITDPEIFALFEGEKLQNDLRMIRDNRLQRVAAPGKYVISWSKDKSEIILQRNPD